MAFKSTDQCLAKVGEDEPIFVLRAKDAIAPDAIEYWADSVEEAYDNEGEEITEEMEARLQEARHLAVEMRNWPNRKLPD